MAKKGAKEEFSKVYTPATNNVVIEYRMKDKTKAGVIIPEAVQEKDYIVEIVSVGPQIEGFNVGDWVILSQDAVVYEVPLDFSEEENLKYGQVKYHHIMGTVDPKWLETKREKPAKLEA